MKTRKHVQFGLVFVLPAIMVNLVGMVRQADGALIASWDFFEGTGTSAAANEVEIGDAVFGSWGSGSHPTWVAGTPVPGTSDYSALHFVRPDSSNSHGGYAAVSTDNVFNFPVEGNFSVAVWLRMPNPAGTTGLVTTLDTGAITGWGLVAFAGGNVQLEVKPVGGPARYVRHSARSLMDSGEWFHLAATYEGGNAGGNSTAALALYLNGQQVATDTVDFGGSFGAFPDHNLHFGAYANLTRGLQGAIDGVRIFDHVLSGSEVAALVPEKYTWTGGTGDWHVDGNWAPSGVPGAGEVATIGTGGLVTISDTRSVGHVMVANNASLRLQDGSVVTGDALSLTGSGGSGNPGVLRNLSGQNEWAGPITLHAGQTNYIGSDSGTLTLSGPVTFLGSQAAGFFVANGSGNITVIGDIAGGTAGGESVATSYGFSGTLTLSGTNTYAGYTRINAGTLSVAGGSAIPDASRVWLFGDGRLNLQANETIGSLHSDATTTQVTLNGNTLTTGGDGINREFRGAISGTGGLTKIGAGIQTLKGSGIAYQGDTAVAGGRLVFEDATNFGNNQPGPTTMTLSNDSTLEFKLGAGNHQNVGLAGQVTISGNGSLVKSGAGTLLLGGQHSYSGDTTIEGGTLTLQGGVRVGGSELWLDASDSASLTLTGGNTVEQWADRSGNDRHAVAAGLSQPLSTTNPLVHDLGVVRFNGTDQILNVDLTFLADSEYTIFAVEGRTSSRTLNYFLGTATAEKNEGLHLGYRDNTNYTLAQHQNDLNHPVPTYTSQEFRVWTNVLDFDFGHAIHLNGADPFTNSNKDALITANNGRIGAGQRPTQVQWFHGDLGELILFDRALSPTERQAVEAYLLRKWLGGLSATNVLPADTNLRIAGGATFDLGGINQTVASLADHGVAGGSVINSGISTATLNIAGTATTEFSGTLADGPAGGSLGLTHSGSGTLVLSGDNTYTGPTTVAAGILRIQSDTALGSAAGGTTVAAGATLQFPGGMTVSGESLSLAGGGVGSGGALRNVSGENEWAGPITMQAGQTNRIGVDSGTLTLSGPVTLSGTQTAGFLVVHGGGHLIVSGDITGGTPSGESVATSGGLSGTLTLSGTNSYAGHTRINAGTLSVAGGSAIPDVSRVWFFGSGTLNLQANETIGSLDSASTNSRVTLNANTLTVGGDNSNQSFAGVISGAGGLTKTGSGIQTLTNANTYFGATTIEDDGTLRLTGAGAISNSALIHVSDTGATFDVSAKTGGFTLGPAQTLKGIGTVDVGGNTLTLEGILEPGNSIGTLTIGGDLTLGSASQSNFEVAGWDFGEYDLVQGSGLYPDETVTFDGLLSVAFDSAVRPGSAMIFDFDHYAGDFADFTYTGLAGWMTASFAPTTGVLSVVPEPGTWVLLLLALVCALPARRRR